MPVRIQRKRTKGWRMPEGAVYVGRPTIFGNPFHTANTVDGWRVADDNDVEYDYWPTKHAAALHATQLFYADLTNWGRLEHQDGLAEAIAGLRGKDLACWCPLSSPCHADVLLELAAKGGA